jgi:hypothetical protein
MASILWCSLRFSRKNYVRFDFISTCFVDVRALFTLFVFIYAYCCLCRFHYDMMFLTQWPRERGQKDKQRSTKHTHEDMYWLRFNVDQNVLILLRNMSLWVNLFMLLIYLFIQNKRYPDSCVRGPTFYSHVDQTWMTAYFD